jgi:hypothetical protein
MHTVNKWNNIFPLNFHFRYGWIDRRQRVIIPATLIYIVSVKLYGNPVFNTEVTFLNYSVDFKIVLCMGR